MQQRFGMECDGSGGVVVLIPEAAEGASLINVIVDLKWDGSNWCGEV